MVRMPRLSRPYSNVVNTKSLAQRPFSAGRQPLDRAEGCGRAWLADGVRKGDGHGCPRPLVRGQTLAARVGWPAERDLVGHRVAHLTLGLRDVARFHRRADRLDLVREAGLREHVPVEGQVRVAPDHALGFVEARAAG